MELTKQTSKERISYTSLFLQRDVRNEEQNLGAEILALVGQSSFQMRTRSNKTFEFPLDLPDIEYGPRLKQACESLFEERPQHAIFTWELVFGGKNSNKTVYPNTVALRFENFQENTEIKTRMAWKYLSDPKAVNAVKSVSTEVVKSSLVGEKPSIENFRECEDQLAKDLARHRNFLFPSLWPTNDLGF